MKKRMAKVLVVVAAVGAGYAIGGYWDLAGLLLSLPVCRLINEV